MQQHGLNRLGCSVLALLAGGILLAGCTSEPSDPAPVILGVTSAAEVTEAASPIALAATPKSAPIKTAERAKKPASHSAARNVRHRPVLARAAHWKALLDTKQFAKARQTRPVKVAAATRKVSRAASEVIPLDTPPTR